MVGKCVKIAKIKNKKKDELHGGPVIRKMKEKIKIKGKKNLLSVRDGASRGLLPSPAEAGSVCFIMSRSLFRTFPHICLHEEKPTLAQSSHRTTKNKSEAPTSSAPAHHEHSKSTAKL